MKIKDQIRHTVDRARYKYPAVLTTSGVFMKAEFFRAEDIEYGSQNTVELHIGVSQLIRDTPEAQKDFRYYATERMYRYLYNDLREDVDIIMSEVFNSRNASEELKEAVIRLQKRINGRDD